jgi:threonylcarbamoyladenosine tRNA methylthiotransferase MtaB
MVTFGCRVNQADSLGIEAALRAWGARDTPPGEADVIVVNTCSVTAGAEQGARQTVRRLRRINPSARIVLTGCYATRAADEVGALPGVVHVVANDRKALLPDEVAALAGLTTSERFGEGYGACGAPVEPGIAGRTAWTLRVQTGCDEGCSYCIIPVTRGRSRSRTVSDVVGEVEQVTRWGFREIAITGVHLGSYGRDLSPPTDLLALARALSSSAWRGASPGEAAGDPVRPSIRLRLSSLEPMDCPAALVDLVADDRAFAPHVHLPLQHASARVLEAMRRPYTLSQYGQLVDLVRRRVPCASIGADVIVGFPGETDEDAEILARYLESSPITHVHVFPYSDRPGTGASHMDGKIHGAVVRARGDRLRAVGHDLTRRFHESQLGAVRPGLTLEDGTLVVTDNYLKVRVAPGHGRNEWVDVRIDGFEPVLRGTVVASTSSRPPSAARSIARDPRR